MNAYYNENDPYAAEWLRRLIAAGHIAPGEVDERSVVDVRGDDLRGFDQCHFFAGIGVWSYAFRLAGWPDDRPVWTGSCPCQPFSAAGKRQGTTDDRHLWPEFHRLIAALRPVTVFGEQVASKDGLAWLDIVHADLEAAGYAVGAVDTCAAGFGAPHIRQRLYFVAESEHAERRTLNGPEQDERDRCDAGRTQAHSIAGARCQVRGLADLSSQRCGETRTSSKRSSEWIGERGEPGELADSNGSRRRAGRAGEAGDGRDASRIEPSGLRVAGDVGDAGQPRLEGHEWHGDNGDQPGRLGEEPPRSTGETGGPCNGFWRDAQWLPCIDGKARAVEPGTFPLAYGAAARVGRLRAYGNAIVAPQAAEFVRAYMELRS